MHGARLVPLKNFGEVLEGKIYRGAQPIHSHEYWFLANTLGIKYMVNLRDDVQRDGRYAPKYGMETITIPVKDHNPPTLQQAQEFMDFIRQDTRYPVYMHCEHGEGRTSTFSVLAKIALGMTLEEALKHEQEVFGFTFRHRSQLQFLKNNF